MKLFTPVILLLVIGIIFLARSHKTFFGKFIIRFVFLFLMTATIATSIFPEIATKIAHLLGIGRGSDLILYLTTVSLVGITTIIYKKFEEINFRLGSIVRNQAIISFTQSLNDVD